MKTWKLVTVAVVALGLFTVPASAMWWSNPKAAERLGLTDEQVEQLESTALEHRKEGIDLHSKMRIAQLELLQLWKADTLDEGKILSRVKGLAKLREEGMLAQAQHRLDCSTILTPEQRKKIQKFQKFVGQRRGRAMAGRGRGMPGRGRGMPGRSRGMTGQGQGFRGRGPGAPAWGPPPAQQGPGPSFRPGAHQGWGRFQAPGPQSRPGRGYRQWGALDVEDAPFEDAWLPSEEDFEVAAFLELDDLFLEEPSEIEQ